MTTSISAHIKKARGKGVWLFIDRDKKTEEEEIRNLFDVIRDEDEAGNVAYAFLEEEIEVVRDACNKYLEGNE